MANTCNANSKWVNAICEVGMLRRVMKHWKSMKAHLSDQMSPGFLPVYVGQKRKRFLIPTRFLKFPIFIALLQKSEEEYGFQFSGGIALPCEVDFFIQVLKVLDKNEKKYGSLQVHEFLKAISEVGFDSCMENNNKNNNFSSMSLPLIMKARA